MTLLKALALAATGLLALAAQVSAPAFEVTSVKPNNSGSELVMMEPQPGGRFMATNVSLRMLIQNAYQLPPFRIEGGPNWIASARFDVAAAAEGNPPQEQMRLMLQKLLSERFRLTAHTETRELPIYALVMARSDGRMGPQFRRAEADCAGADRPSLDLGVGASPSSGPPRCGYFGFSPSSDFPSGRGGLAFRGLTMPALANILTPMVRRTVRDKTGLAGYFDAEFDFMAEVPPPPPPPGVPNPFGSEPFVSVFTVLPEQLGLKLESTRGLVDVLVIDRAERPTEN